MVKCHGNANQLGSTEKSYIRTSKEILTKSGELLSSGMNIRDVYDSLNTLSGGPLGSTSQSNEPRNIKQLRNQKMKLRENKEAKPIKDELTSAFD